MRYAYLSVSVLLLIYILLRAVNVDLTCDEGWTYFAYAHAPFADIVSCNPPAANNHVLNSLLVKLFIHISTAEFFLRLPSVLAFLLYLYSIYRISALVCSSNIMRFCFFIALLANVSLISFFALSRGYGLSIGLMMFSVYQILLLMRSKGVPMKHVHLSMLFAVLATYASFTLLTWALASILVVCYVMVSRSGRSKRMQHILVPCGYLVIIAVLCGYPIWRLISAGELYYGGEKNFIDDTLLTMFVDLTDGFIYGNTLRIDIVLGIAISLLLFSFIITGWQFATRRANAVLVTGPIILALCIAAINTQFYLLHSKLLIYRTALYLYPLMVWSVFSGLAMIRDSKNGVKTSISVTISAALVLCFVTHMNIYITREWWFDSYTEQMLEDIDARKAKDKKVRLLPDWKMANTVNYYIERKYSGKIEPAPFVNEPAAGLDLSAYDFIYLMADNSMSSHPEFAEIRSYHHDNFKLYQRRSK